MFLIFLCFHSWTLWSVFSSLVFSVGFSLPVAVFIRLPFCAFLQLFFSCHCCSAVKQPSQEHRVLSDDYSCQSSLQVRLTSAAVHLFTAFVPSYPPSAFMYRTAVLSFPLALSLSIYLRALFLFCHLSGCLCATGQVRMHHTYSIGNRKGRRLTGKHRERKRKRERGSCETVTSSIPSLVIFS